MSEQPPEDPLAHASAKITSYVSVAAVAAEAIAQVAAARARERAATDERATRALRAARQAAYGQARLGWAPILDPKLRARAGLLDAGEVWAGAQPWRPDPEAERASRLAEDRLAELRPDVMDRYDRLRADGTEPVEAMRRVAPYFDQPPPRTGEPAPGRAALTEQDTARRAGDAELTRYRAKTAVADDPRTPRVDEHADALAAAAPHRDHAAAQHSASPGRGRRPHPGRDRRRRLPAAHHRRQPRRRHDHAAAAAGRPVQHRAAARHTTTTGRTR